MVSGGECPVLGLLALRAQFIFFIHSPLVIHPPNTIITPMHVESLKVFCDLVSLRSFSKAAKANATSQPTVSRVVHQLEDRLGGRRIAPPKRPSPTTPLSAAAV